MLAKIGPGMNSNVRSFWLKTLAPVTSDGSRSGVHWMRRNLPPTDVASARASMVFPVPGRSWSRMCPPATSPVSASRTAWSLPTMTRWMLFSTRSSVSAARRGRRLRSSMWRISLESRFPVSAYIDPRDLARRHGRHRRLAARGHRRHSLRQPDLVRGGEELRLGAAVHEGRPETIWSGRTAGRRDRGTARLVARGEGREADGRPGRLLHHPPFRRLPRGPRPVEPRLEERVARRTRGRMARDGAAGARRDFHRSPGQARDRQQADRRSAYWPPTIREITSPRFGPPFPNGTECTRWANTISATSPTCLTSTSPTLS